MSIDEIKKHMKAKKITYQMLSDMSNIPLTTLKSIFCGTTKNPRIDTMDAIETALGTKEKSPDNAEAFINRFKSIGLTPEKFNTLSEEKKQDILQIVKVFTKDK